MSSFSIVEGLLCLPILMPSVAATSTVAINNSSKVDFIMDSCVEIVIRLSMSIIKFVLAFCARLWSFAARCALLTSKPRKHDNYCRSVRDCISEASNIHTPTTYCRAGHFRQGKFTTKPQIIVQCENLLDLLSTVSDQNFCDL